MIPGSRSGLHNLQIPPNRTISDSHAPCLLAALRPASARVMLPYPYTHTHAHAKLK